MVFDKPWMLALSCLNCPSWLTYHGLQHHYRGLSLQSITSRIELVDDSGDDIIIRYRSACLEDESLPRSSCTGIKTGDLVTFQVQVEAAGCPQQKVRDLWYHWGSFQV